MQFWAVTDKLTTTTLQTGMQHGDVALIILTLAL